MSIHSKSLGFTREMEPEPEIKLLCWIQVESFLFMKHQVYTWDVKMKYFYHFSFDNNIARYKARRDGKKDGLTLLGEFAMYSWKVETCSALWLAYAA